MKQSFQEKLVRVYRTFIFLLCIWIPGEGDLHIRSILGFVFGCNYANSGHEKSIQTGKYDKEAFPGAFVVSVGIFQNFLSFFFWL